MTTPGSGIEPAYATALPAPQGGALPTSLEWQALERMAHTLADSDVIPYRLKRKPADVAVILLAAREYGIPPLMALSKLPVVNGTPAPMGELMVALVLRAGHSIRAKVYNEDGSERKGEGARQPITPGTYAECVTRRRDEAKGDEDVLTFTIAEALSAGLVDRLEDGRTVAVVTKTKNGTTVEEPTPWQQYPDNMLRWRAVANACRLRFPDVLLGLSYLPEELGAIVDADGAPILEGEVTQPPPAPRRAPAGTVEQRTAQETADRLATFVGDPAVLDNVLAHAVDNGYADALVDHAGSSAVPLREAIAHKREELERRVVEHAATAAQEAATAPQEPAGAPAAPESPGEPTAPATAPASDPLADLVYFAVTTGDVDVIRELYREHKATLDVDVTEHLEADDPRILGITAPVKLGALLMALGKRLAAGDGPLEVPTGDDGVTVEDPPADRWPDQPDAHPDELPLPGE